MILKKGIKKEKKYNINKFLLSYFIISILLAIILLIFIFQSVAFKQVKSKSLDILSKGGRYEYIYLPNIIFSGLKSNFYKLKKINLEIKFENSLILENIRNQAIKDGSLPNTDLNSRVNFKLNYDKKIYPGKIRLKGDRKVHYEDKEKSSYKIELDKNKYIFGVSKFSLQKPRLRNYVHEWIFHQMSKDFDLIKIKYEFLDLSINGEKKGLYVLEEGFGKDLIERNKRRNGPIFGLNEDLSPNPKDLVFEIYNKKYWAKKENKELAENASQKLKDFFNQKIPLEDVFDLNRWASYFAIVDFTSTYHGALLKSVKLYYNPINGLFEPIPFDGHRLKPNYHKYNLNYDDRLLIDIVNDPSNLEETRSFDWLNNFFYKKNKQLNDLFYNLYIKNLDLISSKNYLDKFLKENYKKIKQINSHIYSDYFFYDNSRDYTAGLYYFLLTDFFYRSNDIKKKLKLKNGIQAIKKIDSSYIIKNFYKNYIPIEIVSILCDNNGQLKPIKIKKNLNNFSNTLIKTKINLGKNAKCEYFNLLNKLNDNSFTVKIDQINSEYNFENFKKNNIYQWSKFFYKKGNKLLLLNDTAKINEDIYIPKGFEINIKPGQKILLTNNAFIVSRSPWIIGGEDRKTIVSGLKDNLGGGIIILDNNRLSKIANTKFSYLSGYNFDLNSEFLILGALNFHQTKVNLNNVSFESIYSEDAINIFRSTFKIKNTNYKDISSDAIDIDFSNGTIESVNFKNIANDAMDFSGSNVEINISNFDNVQDKLISGGEQSNLKISNINASNSKSGIISKDGSKVFSKNIFFENVQVPFAAYQKKSQYEYGFLVVDNYKVENFLIKFAKDNKSEIILDKIVQVSSKKHKKILNYVNQ